MQKLSIVLASALILAGCSTSPTTDSQVANDYCGRGEIVAGALNLRSHPALGNNVLTLLPRGTRLNVLQCSPVQANRIGWIKVETVAGTDDMRGWISANDRYVLLQEGTSWNL